MESFGVGLEALAVRPVAVAAGDASRKHFALLERAVIIDLIAHLPVGLVVSAPEWRDHMRVRKLASRHPILGELAAARVAQPAALDLLAQQRRREAAPRIAGRRIDWPKDIAPLIEADEEPL